MTINKWAAVVGTVVTIDVVKELTINGLLKGEMVTAETTVALLIVVGLENMEGWQKMMATSLIVEHLLRH